MESFYGGRQGISFIIVKRFDGIDIEPNTSFTIKYFAFDTSKNNFILDENNTPILKTHITSKIYKDWKLHETDGSEIIYEEQIGNFPMEYAEGMIQCFAQGGMTTDVVNYGEYVIIDTPDKNNVDNGKIYRRGLDYQNDLAGAEYIGQIVGPQGDSPEIMMDSFTTLVEAGGPQISYEKDDIIPGIELDEEGNPKLDENGKPIKGNNIQSSWITLKDQFGVITGCKIGFKFPYHVLSFVAESVSAYTEDELIERIDDKSYAYFSQWKISIPKGIKGNALSDLHIVNSVAKNGASYYEDINCNNLLGTLLNETKIEINNENYTEEENQGRPILIDNIIRYVKKEDTDRQILIYKETNFDRIEEGDNSYIIIGDYNMINEIILDTDGTLTIDYTYGDTTVFEKRIKWIDNITFDKNQGQITLIFNTGETKILNEKDDEKIKWINDIYLESNGQLKVKYNIDNGNETIINTGAAVQWINAVNLTSDGKLEVTYNTKLEKEIVNTNNPIQWIEDIIFNDNEGFIKVKYNTELPNEEGVKVGISLNNEPIKWATNIKLTDDGDVKIKYNIDPESVENEEGDLVPFEGTSINENDKIRWIKHDSDSDEYGIKINTNAKDIIIDESGEEHEIDLGEGTGSQKIQVTYNTGETHEIGKPLNYIIECVVTHNPSLLSPMYKNEDGKVKVGVAEAGHLLVIYSDPAYRTYLKDNNKCKIWPSTKMNQNNEGYFDEWYDMGIAKGDPGTVKVVTTYTTEQLKPIFENKQTPEELFGDEYKGWLIGKQDIETDPVILYYYDYQIVTIDGIESVIGWKELGAVTAAASLLQPENIVEINTSVDKVVDLKTNGLLFVKKNEEENIITSIIEKVDNDIINPENNFSKPYYFSSFAKYINPTLNAGVNTLEEQLLIGFNTITEEWMDENNNTHVKTKFLMDENEQEYYILYSIIYSNENIVNDIIKKDILSLYKNDIETNLLEKIISQSIDENKKTTKEKINILN